jgi:hypothetical protein
VRDRERSASTINHLPRLFPDDARFEFEAIPALGVVDHGGSAVGEVLVATRTGGQRVRFRCLPADSDEARARALDVLKRWFSEKPTANEVLSALE